LVIPFYLLYLDCCIQFCVPNWKKDMGMLDPSGSFGRLGCMTYKENLSELD